MKLFNRVLLTALLLAAPLAAEQPQLVAVVGSNFAAYGFGAPWTVAPGSDVAVVFALVFYPRTQGADQYSIRVTFLVGDERRTESKTVESVNACSRGENYGIAWPCAAIVILARGADTLRPVKLLSVAVDSEAIIGRLELKLE